MNNKNLFGQFYTPDFLAKIIVLRALHYMEALPSTVLELAAGEGHLLTQILAVAPNANVTAVDIDVNNTTHLKSYGPNLVIYNQDGISALEGIPDCSFDMGLGNPPFLSNIVIDEYKHDLLKTTMGLDISVGKLVRSEFIFICQYLKFISNGGILTIIVPESIVSGERHQYFRAALLRNWEVVEIYQVDGTPFLSTEAKTHVLTIKKSKNIKSSIDIKALSSKGVILGVKNIPVKSLIERMDYSYYASCQMLTAGLKRLDKHASIARGNISHKHLKDIGIPYIHTTTFKHLTPQSFSHSDTPSSKYVTAKLGDVLMCRVGSRVVGKIMVFTGRETVISDCVFRIRFRDKGVRDEFLLYLESELGSKAISSRCRGVCSRYLTKTDLASFYF
ncbi:N-6 DNA methylase [Shewanella frigidimarina]|uniref:N-6 DNA methylase n=1 Tax=Shewanella frigidimarina TaxID=56812 RepID=UPI003D7BCDED